MEKEKFIKQMQDPEEVKRQEDNLIKTVDELIDSDLNVYMNFIKKRTLGELMSMRLYVDNRLLEVNNLCSVALNPSKILDDKDKVSRTDMHTIIQLFVVSTKIDVKKVLMDREIESRKLKK